jgi:hypothetical protein
MSDDARSADRHAADEEERGPEPETDVDTRPRSRRSLLQLLGAVAVGAVGGAAIRSDGASAVDGAVLVVGDTNSSTGKTVLLNSGPITNDGAFVVEAQAADWALEGSSGQVGVLGSGFVGVTGTGDIGGYFSGNLAAISLQPQSVTGAPTSGDYSRGDILVDAAGVMYLCVADGNPGTWIQLSHGGYRPLPAPIRAYDSRQGSDGKLRPGAGDTATPRSVQITGVVAGVPSNAVAVAGNLAVTQGEGAGFATLWPSGAWPGTANINFGSGDLSNAFTVGLGASGQINVAASAPAHVIIDVAGFIL